MFVKDKRKKVEGEEEAKEMLRRRGGTKEVKRREQRKGW